MVEVGALGVLVSRANVVGVRIGAVRGEPLLDRTPVERLVAVPVVARGVDHADRAQAVCLDRRDRGHEGRVRSVGAPIVLRWRPAPVRLPDDHVTTRPFGRGQRIDRAVQPVEHERRAKAERGVVRSVSSRSRDASASRNARRSPRPSAAVRATAAAWNSGVISTPSTEHPNARASTSAGPPRPEAMSSTCERGPSRNRSPRSTTFSTEVGFWSSWSRSAMT